METIKVVNVRTVSQKYVDVRTVWQKYDVMNIQMQRCLFFAYQKGVANV